ncbi:MAG: YicC family protein [Clostridium sp. 42_12]|nr:MAG: YicC family protein [Clostridium sp. 42_12]
MIKSMTGFGRYETVTDEYRIAVEIKSVNHRYCDLNIKLPKKFNEIENTLRMMMKEIAERGKVDVYVSYEDYAGRGTHVHYHPQIAKEYVKVAAQVAEEFELHNSLSAERLLGFADVISLEEESNDLESVFPIVTQTLQKAGEQFIASREREGEQLYQDIKGKLAYLLTLVAQVEERSPQMLQEHRQKLLEKVQELLGDRKIDEGILATELIVYADKVCVDEETVRLRSHIDAMSETLDMQEAIGRKLDFIAQEMNREANTILSKANDKELSGIAINLKTEIEKIREQIQNIE